MKKLRVGVIGAGGMAVNHIKAYCSNPAVEVIALCDKNSKLAKTRAGEFGIKDIYDDYRQMLKRNDMDAINIVTPNITHTEFTITALNEGKHVLCEKPPGMNVMDAVNMVEAAKANERLLMFGFNGRFSEKVQYLKGISREGSFGEIYYIKTGYIRRCGNPGGWFATKDLSGGGPLIDLGVHMIDLALYLLDNSKPEFVFASSFSKFGKRSHIKGIDWYKSAGYESGKFDTEDLAVALVKFENGATLFLETSFDMHMKEKEEVVYMDVFGDKAGARIEPGFEIFTEKNDYLIDIKPVLDDPTLNWSKCLDSEINHFVDCILNSTPCIYPAEDAIPVMKIIDAIYESTRKGESVHI
jgi:predicted dehydrogenase